MVGRGNLCLVGLVETGSGVLCPAWAVSVGGIVRGRWNEAIHAGLVPERHLCIGGHDSGI